MLVMLVMLVMLPGASWPYPRQAQSIFKQFHFLEPISSKPVKKLVCLGSSHAHDIDRVVRWVLRQ